MPEPPDHSLTRRGAWIGLRTLRQRPKVVDHTENGEPIFEVRSVRLLLRADSDHFNRLEGCTRCGRQVPGAPVLEMADLDRPANPLICTSCVRSVAKPSPLRPDVRRPAADVPRPEDTPESPRAEADDGPPESTQAGASDDGVRQELEAVAGALRERQREASDLASALAEIRAQVDGVGASQRTLAAAQQASDQRLGELAGELAQQRDAPPHVDATLRAGISQLDRAIGELRTWAAASERRLLGLEQRLEKMAAELTEVVIRHSRAPQPDAGELLARGGNVGGHDLLGALERQLEAAEGRLSRLAVPSSQFQPQEVDRGVNEEQAASSPHAGNGNP